MPSVDIRGGVQVVGIKRRRTDGPRPNQRGFVITHINDKPVRSLGDTQRMTDKIRSIDGVYPTRNGAGRAASYTS